MQTYFEDVAIGMEIPSLTKRPSLGQLVKWAGASENFHPIHYDRRVAQQWGVEEVLVHGRLKAAFLTQMLTAWAGEQGFLRKLSCRFLGMDFPDAELTCRGRVIAKHTRNGERLAECEVWVESPKGERTVAGTALVRLPSRRG